MAGNERTNIKIFPTALATDVLFYVLVDETLPKNKNPEYGTSYRECLPHAAPDYPHHKLVFISAADASGLQKWYFAADRENQDDYNWEFTQADFGGVKFDAVRRTYVTPRSEFLENASPNGTAMPNVPANLFSGSFVLAGCQQIKVQLNELDSLYVTEVKTFIRRASLPRQELDIKTGRNKLSSSYIYFRGETVSGTTIESLVADAANAYWGIQADGAFREVSAESEDWFVVTTSSVLPANPINSSGNPAKTRVIQRVTPLGTDVMFYEVGAMPSPVPAYGSGHYSASWPSHILTMIQPADETGHLYKFIYVADRDNQDTYNWIISEGRELTRDYVIPRDEYPDVFTAPGAADPDSDFPQYGFADDTVIEAPEEIRSLYIVVRRRFIEPVIVEFVYNDSLDKTTAIIREVIEPNHDTPPVSSAGRIVEIQHANSFHDIRITRVLADLMAEDPENPGDPIQYELPSIPSTYNRNFPRMLKSVELRWVSAWAYATGQQPSYSEDYYFEFKIVEARPGPYAARIRRFVTEDPQSVMDLYPILIVPQPASESIGAMGWWWHASSETGCSTFASAKEYVIPSTIHEEITIDLNGFDSVSLVDSLENDGRGRTESLPETDGLSTFLTAIEGTIDDVFVTIDYDVKPAPLGLYEVSVIQADLRGLYPSDPP